MLTDSPPAGKVDNWCKLSVSCLGRRLIDHVSEFVSKFGFDFESLLMEREHSNVAYNFLYHTETAEHTYYRWRVYALAQVLSSHGWHSRDSR